MPRGSSQYGWLWIVGIILAVGFGLYLLQNQLPEEKTEPAPQNTVPATAISAVPFGAAGVAKIIAPTAADANTLIGLDWDLTAPDNTTATETSVYWGLESKANAPANEQTAPSDMNYPNTTTEYTQGTFAVPGSFETNLLTPEGGTLFFRVHARMNDRHYWSAEQTIVIKGK